MRIAVVTAALYVASTLTGLNQAGAQDASRPRDSTSARDSTRSTDSAAAKAVPRVQSTTPKAPAGRSQLDGAIEVGARDFTSPLTDIQKAKFEQYRGVVPQGGLLQGLLVRYSPNDFMAVQFTGRHVGQDDQSLYLRANQPGLFDIQVRSDRIPHIFSTDARALGTTTAPGVYALPNPRPDTATLNRAPYIGTQGLVWDPTKLSLGYTPSQHWDTKVTLTQIDKHGERPMGMVFNGSGNDSREIAEPIQQQVHDFRVSQSYSEQRWQLVATYDLSMFHNDLQSVTSADPWQATDATTLSANGRSALPPTNLAHTAMATGAVNLPLRTRVTGTASYGWWRQNQAFIPQTINTAIVNPALSSDSIPGSLNANVHTSLFATTVSSHPWKDVTFAGRFSSYDYKDLTNAVTVPAIIYNDHSLDPASTALRHPWRQRNADLDLSWRIISPLSLGAGFAWNDMTRDATVRNDSLLTERAPRVTLDYTGIPWLDLNASYTKSWRRGEYHQVNPAQMPGFQEFDEANRNRETTALIATINPIDQLTIFAAWDIGHDDYPFLGQTIVNVDYVYGLESDRSNSLAGGIEWSPSQRFTVGGSVVRENYYDRQRSRYRTGTGALLVDTTFDYIAHTTDASVTTSLNATAVVIPDRLEIGGTFEIAHARFVMGAYNPYGTPTGPGATAAQLASATAWDFPEVSQNLQPLSLFVSNRITTDWSINLRYQDELYHQNDFRTAGLQPATTNFVFFGNNLNGYHTRYVTLTATFRPTLFKAGRAAL